MTRDGRKGLDISYNCLNLPSYAETADGSSLTYTYLADGTKVSVVSGCGYGLKYRGSFVYETGDSMDDCLQSIAWDEGRIMLVAPAVDTLVAIEPELPEIDMPGEEVADSALVDIAAGMLRDLFFVIDHLGNVRSVVDVSPDLTEPAILEQDDYLPFGTRVQNPSFAGVDDNRYRYAGKEEQRIGGSDISLLDFGARYYDPYIARWTSIDPMAYMYKHSSSYVYCNNSPLRYIDSQGDSTVVSNTGIILYEDSTDNTVYLYNEDGNVYIGEIGGTIDANIILQNLLETNSELAKHMNPFVLKSLVTSGGYWDYKSNKTTIWGKTNHTETTFKYRDLELTSEDVGNYHFGVVAESNIFIPQNFALKQAGKHQLNTNTSKSEWQKTYESNISIGGVTTFRFHMQRPPYGDDPRDQEMIKQGFKWVKK